MRKLGLILLMFVVAGCKDSRRWQMSYEELLDCADYQKSCTDSGGRRGYSEYIEVLNHRNLDGEHKLRKILPQRETADPYLRGNFFLLFGDLSGGVTRNITVTFSWQMNDGAYTITTIEMDRIRVKLDDVSQEPKVSFRWHYGEFDGAGITGKDFSSRITEVMVTCRPEDWPKSIRMPLN